MSVSSGRISSENAERVWLKFCTGTEISLGYCVSHFGGHWSRQRSKKCGLLMATTMLISASHYLENGSQERLFEIHDPRLVLNGVSKNSMLTVVRYDSVCLTCSKKLTGSQLSLPHGKEAFRDRSGLVVCPRGPARGAENVPQQAYHWETLCQSCTDQLVYLFVPHAKLDCARRAQTLASHLNQK